MNAAEQIVDAYFRVCRGCFTMPDRKVVKGNNRQLDILAYNMAKGDQYHIEVGVTHGVKWSLTAADLGKEFERKFFGVPGERSSKKGKTDHDRGKNYFESVRRTYRKAGFKVARVKRVWVCWVIKDVDGKKPHRHRYKPKLLNRSFDIELLSFRDYVLPKLNDAIGTANYDDTILRTLGFIKQHGLQMSKNEARRKRVAKVQGKRLSK